MTAGASRAATTITPQRALAPSPQPRPAPTGRALPPELVVQEDQSWTLIVGQCWTPIVGQNWTPIDNCLLGEYPRRRSELASHHAGAHKRRSAAVLRKCRLDIRAPQSEC